MVYAIHMTLESGKSKVCLNKIKRLKDQLWSNEGVKCLISVCCITLD